MDQPGHGQPPQRYIIIYLLTESVSCKLEEAIDNSELHTSLSPTAVYSSNGLMSAKSRAETRLIYVHSIVVIKQRVWHPKCAVH